VEEIEEEREENRQVIEDVKEGGDRTVAMLDGKVSKMLANLREEIAQAEDSIGRGLRALDLDGDGMLSHAELVHAMQKVCARGRAPCRDPPPP
jgi:Ca2+-binding EF-hand superfamily protein